MLVIFALIIGGALGAYRAKKRGGNTLDMLQYAAVFMIIFGLCGLAATIIVHRFAT